ncbi:MAG: DUF4249 domain-containing protein [Chitinophagaceae bacterium]|nr:MAG: DUF4249 domain-containing protein [Chitinophagaceae bacterium]
MMKKLCYMLLAVLALGCKDSYDLPVNVPATGYLVVDGTINSGLGATFINLSKTVRLVDSFNINYVTNAEVSVEGEDNSKFPIPHSRNGQYINNQLNLNRGAKYRLRIRLDNKEYVSSYLAVKPSPVIDSINFTKTDQGLDIYVDAKGNANTTGYYRWEYEETWEFNSAYAPNLRYSPVPRAEYIDRGQSFDYSKYTCYQSARSTTIEILSTARLTRDTTHYRITTIPRADWKLSVLYSILARQYSISREGFEYLSKMKKNTEQTGSIFDAQPSELKGNITCVTNPAEPVIGFMEVSDMHSKRIFIKNSQVTPWGYLQQCILTSLVNNPDSIRNAGFPSPVTPSETSPVSSAIVRFWTTDITCIDCTLRGTLTKPTFWP